MLLCFDPLSKHQGSCVPRMDQGGNWMGQAPTAARETQSRSEELSQKENRQQEQQTWLPAQPQGLLCTIYIIYYWHFEKLSSFFLLCLNRQEFGTNEESPNYYRDIFFDWLETFKSNSLEMVALLWRPSFLYI